MKRVLLFALFYITFSSLLTGQPDQLRFFREITLAIDTSVFSWTEKQLEFQGEKHLWFAYREENPVVEMRFYPIDYPRVDSITLLPSGSFSVVDSLLKVNDEYYRLKLQFKDLTESDFLAIHLHVSSQFLRDGHHIHELRLFPTTTTEVSLLVENDELFIGEEKIFKVETNRLKNIIVSNTWTTGREINFKFSQRNDQLFLHLLPTGLGIASLEASLQVKKPYMNDEGDPQYTLPPLVQTFVVKPAKLAFLTINRREVSLTDDAPRQGIEIELDYHSELQMEKTYRLEEREQPGGALIAEIFTRQILANGKALCWLRLYDFHRRTEGYLYIKDGDDAKYITNLDIVPETTIKKISIRREGQDWKASTAVFPGEKIEIRLEGESLNRANFRFAGLDHVSTDSLIRGENEMVFRAMVPVNIEEKRIVILNGNQRTGQSLQVKEYNRPRQLDFVFFSYHGQQISVSEIDKLLFLDKTLPDITIGFDSEKIDQDRLYGEQHLEIEIQVLNKSNQLIDTRTISKILIAPGESSPRYHFYNQGKTQKTAISINDYLRKKTFDLDIWTSIKITIKHREDKYEEEGFEKTTEFVLFRSMTFNIDVSFPAGLIVKRLHEPGFGNLGGISMAMMAQFSFYKGNTIGKEKPYKFGLGFLAFNAFNFSDNNDDRDVGLVALASLYPIRTKESSRLSFPLYTGIGYFLSESKWFLLLGPGIRLRL